MSESELENRREHQFDPRLCEQKSLACKEKFISMETRFNERIASMEKINAINQKGLADTVERAITNTSGAIGVQSGDLTALRLSLDNKCTEMTAQLATNLTEAKAYTDRELEPKGKNVDKIITDVHNLKLWRNWLSGVAAAATFLAILLRDYIIKHL